MFRRRTAAIWLTRSLLVVFVILSLVGMSLETQSVPVAHDIRAIANVDARSSYAESDRESRSREPIRSRFLAP